MCKHIQRHRQYKDIKNSNVILSLQIHRYTIIQMHKNIEVIILWQKKTHINKTHKGNFVAVNTQTHKYIEVILWLKIRIHAKHM